MQSALESRAVVLVLEVQGPFLLRSSSSSTEMTVFLAACVPSTVDH